MHRDAGSAGEFTMADVPGLVPVRRINDAGLVWRPPSPEAEDPSARRRPEDEVYLALRVDDGTEVAVRVYGRCVRTERDRERFGREIAALKALAGEPHLVGIHDGGVTPSGRAYVVMDYCEAGSLRDHIATVGRFTPVEVRRIGTKVAGALARVHRGNLVHRDIRPANILINSGGEPVLANFGLGVLATSDGDFTPPTPPGPRPFVAPEALLPELMTPAADIFALGATLYALLAGRPPRTASPLAVAIDGDTVAELPRVPWALMAIVRRAMALDPRDRFTSAEEFRDALSIG